MRKLKKHIDTYGQLVQKRSRDDMDSAQRHGMIWLGWYLSDKSIDLPEDLSPPVLALKHFESPDSPGDYMRSGNPNSRGYYPDMLTRDQQTGIIALMLLSKTKNRCKDLMLNNLERGWFTNNWTSHRTDREKEPEKVGKSHPNFAGLSQLAMCFRVMHWWWIYPLIVLLDAELIFSAIKYRWFSKQREPLNFMLRCGTTMVRYKTPTAWLARKITKPNDMYERVVRYFDRGEDKGPPMYVIWNKKLLQKIFS